MDYKKAYEEMVQIARELHKGGNALTKQQMEIVCPELSESKDARVNEEIRNFLIDMECKREWIAYLEKRKDCCGKTLIRDNGESACSYIERCLTPEMRKVWYEACAEIKEKQKEQNIYKSSKSEIDFADRYSKDVWEKLMSKFKAVKGYRIGCNDVSDIVLNAILNAFKWQKEQKSEQSEMEKAYVRTLHSLIADFLRGKQEIDREYYQKIWDCLDNRHIEQKPAEWGEKDRKMLEVISYKISQRQGNDERSLFTPDEAEFMGEIEDKLKSHPQWKPSEEQMKAVICAIEECGYNSELESLYNDLKKL